MRGWPSLLLLALLAACHDAAPEGQVIARVDGRDLTTTELAAEARANPAPRPALVDSLVGRALLAEAARAQGADLSPMYLADMRRARDMLLIESLRRKIAAGLPIPDDERTRSFIAAHPWAYARRLQVAVTGPDGAAARLDTATVAPETAALVAGAAPGGDVTIDGTRYHVVARRSVPVTGAAALAQARAALSADDTDRRMRAILEQARGRASVRYQTGFGPADER